MFIIEYLFEYLLSDPMIMPQRWDTQWMLENLNLLKKMCHPCDFASDTPMIIDVQILKHLHFETVYFPLLFSEIMKTTFFTNIFSLLRSSWSVKSYIYFMFEYLLNVFKMPGWNKINIFSCLMLNDVTDRDRETALWLSRYIPCSP